jgi:hypothetical protein
MKIFAAALVLVAATGVTAEADQPDRRMSINTFHSFATVQATVTPIATCQGKDGVTYTVLSVQGEGPITSDDPRMAGIFHADALILDSPATGYGVSKDDWTVTDPTTGALKASGTAYATDFGPHPRAITVAELADGSHMWANTVVTLPAPGTSDPITIEYGGPGLDEPDRGVIVGGSDPCTKLMFKHL